MRPAQACPSKLLIQVRSNESPSRAMIAGYRTGIGKQPDETRAQRPDRAAIFLRDRRRMPGCRWCRTAIRIECPIA